MQFFLISGSSTYCILTDRITIKVKNLINTNAYDVAKVEWLERCIERKKLLNWYVVIIITKLHFNALTTDGKHVHQYGCQSQLYFYCLFY